MKRILIISGGTLPVPAVKGGAVETLIDLLIEQNEKEPAFLLDVVSGGSLKKTEEDNRYQYTAFHRISYPAAVRFKDAVQYWYMEKIRHNWRSMFVRNKEKSRYYAKKLTERLSLREYDAIIVENNMSLLEPIAKQLGERFSEICFYHMHSVLVDNPAMIPYLAKCRKILVVSDYVKRELYKSVPEFSDTYIEKVTNGIKIPVIDEEELEERIKLRKKYGIANDERVFLYCGRLSPEKGVLELVKAFCAAKMECARLVVTGAAFSGENVVNGYVKQLYELAADCGERIVFTGYIPHERMGSYYRMADVLVVPSLVGDAAPLTVLEGMANGIYLIASDKGGIPEYSKEYRSKMLVTCNENFISNLQQAMEDYCKVDLKMSNQEEKIFFSDADFFREMRRAILTEENESGANE